MEFTGAFVDRILRGHFWMGPVFLLSGGVTPTTKEGWGAVT